MNKRSTSNRKAVVLLSGGLDSSTVLYFARNKGFNVHCLAIDYGQRHRREIKAAKKIASAAGCALQVVKVSMPWKGSALLDPTIAVPKGSDLNRGDIPVTYVPGRNIIFLSLAASCAEAIGARHIFIGANAIDYSGYPDCRPEFIESFQIMIAKGLKAGVEGRAIRVEAPLIRLSKAQIVKLALKLKVPLRFTWSCYQGKNRPCGICDSCRLRRQGFDEAGIIDH